MRSLYAQLRARKFWRFAILPAGLLIFAAIGNGPAGALQNDVARPSSQPSTPFGDTQEQRDPDVRLREEKMAKARNVDRQQRLVNDTGKLLALAKELKEEVDKSNKNTLSIDVVKKASEIEKLAKSVKERMRE